MLSKLISSVSLLCLLANGQTCPELGKTPNMQTGMHNYVVDYFSDAIPFPFAINRCTSNSLLSSKFYKYTCDKNNDMKWAVTKLEYTESDCTGTPNSLGDWVEGDAEAGDIGDFSCDGDNTYVKVDIDIQADCPGAKTVFAGLGACVNYGTRQIRTYCNDTLAEMQFYGNINMTCPSATYCAKWSFSSTCAAVGQTILGGSVYTVYGKIDECLGVVPTTTGQSSSAPAKFAVLNLIFALIVSLVWFL